jgi:ribonuclease BN (tRNA processing enzyme)
MHVTSIGAFLNDEPHDLLALSADMTPCYAKLSLTQQSQVVLAECVASMGLSKNAQCQCRAGLLRGSF